MKVKNLFISIILIMAVIGTTIVPVCAKSSINIGDYILMGTYYDKPILWRCVDIDENGPLILSDKIICYKPFDTPTKSNNTTGSHSRNSNELYREYDDRDECGSNFWGDSNLRSWLNSDAIAGNIEWLCGNPPSEKRFEGFDKEAGFLTNFSDLERSSIKQVTQETVVAYEEGKNGVYSTKGDEHEYHFDDDSVDENGRYGVKAEFVDYLYKMDFTDYMFLLDEEQHVKVHENREILGNGYYRGIPTPEAYSNIKITSTQKEWYKYYWMRAVMEDTKTMVYDLYEYKDDGDSHSNATSAYSDEGVRPAFYLADSASFAIGDGSVKNPYIVDKNSKAATIPYVYEEGYEYYEIDFGENVYVSGKLDDITDKDSAKDVVNRTSKYLTDNEKSSATGVDKLTLLSEEAVAKVSTQEINEEVIHITEPVVKELEPTAIETAKLLDDTLNSNGVKTQRAITKTVGVKTSKTGVVKVKKDVADTSADKVKIQTSFASVSIDAKESTEFSLESKGTNKVAVTFETDKTTTLKIAFPGMKENSDYMAVVDENGNAVGGKYNPATGEIEAKISESGVYSVVENEKDFEDIKEKAIEMQNAIKTLAAKGVINGTSETTFSPDDKISRAEIAALIVRTLSKLDPNADGGFADVTRENWYFGAAGSSKKHGIINGFEDNTFRGELPIAKEEIVAVTARVLKNEMKYKVPKNTAEYLLYADEASIPQWAREDVALANMANLVMHRTDNKFVANEQMTRGDAAVILMRLFNKVW